MTTAAPLVSPSKTRRYYVLARRKPKRRTEYLQGPWPAPSTPHSSMAFGFKWRWQLLAWLNSLPASERTDLTSAGWRPATVEITETLTFDEQ